MTKSTRPMLRIHDLATNEILDREMNDAEYKEHLENLQASAIRQAEAETRRSARAALLDKLGITADEAKLLLG